MQHAGDKRYPFRVETVFHLRRRISLVLDNPNDSWIRYTIEDMSNHTPLSGKTAIVTGAGRGLGRAYARQLAVLGAAVVVTDLDADSVSSVADQIAHEGGHALSLEFDVSNEPGVVNAVHEVDSWSTDPVSILINNAALFATIPLKPFTEISVDEWDSVLEVNVRGSFLMAKHVVPLMARSGYGKIVNISSSTIWTGRPGYLHYVTSKSALVGMTRALARELGSQGIRVNAVTPGPTRTEVERATMDETRWQAVAEMSALGAYATPSDICAAVMFLVSPDSDHITGQTLNVDAGISMP